MGPDPDLVRRYGHGVRVLGRDGLCLTDPARNWRRASANDAGVGHLTTDRVLPGTNFGNNQR